MKKSELRALTGEELGTLERGLEISLQFVGSKAGRQTVERLIQQCVDERHRRDEEVLAAYNKKMKGQ